MRGGSGLDPRLHDLASAVTEGVMTVRDDCVAWANERLAVVVGRAGLPLEGMKIAALFRDLEDGVPRTDGPATLECSAVRSDGQLRSVLCRRAWPDDANGTSCWVIEDVSHAREVERELLRAGRDLSEANRELAAAHEHLRSERAEREELLLVVSHELRTPLTVIGGYVRLLLSEEVGPLTEEQRRFLEESQKSAKRLSGFIGNILDAKRAAKGDEVLEVGPAPVAPVVEAVASMFERLVSEREIDLHLELDPSLRACFDATRVEQILTNLLGNAIRFVPRGGSIEISLALCAVRGREFIEVAVADDGPGVAHEDRERIFEPYVQGGEEGHRGGLGLGLAVCRRLVEAHGGSIGLTDRPGGGARFAFTLPAVGAAREES